MNPPSVLLDQSFLAAISDADHPDHDEAVATYRSLVDDFVEQRCLLVARADHLRSVAKPDVFAAVDKLHIARQHRNAATELVALTGVAMDEAITMVLIHRCRIRRVLSFDERLAGYDVDLKVTVASVAPRYAAGDTLDVAGAAELAPEAG